MYLGAKGMPLLDPQNVNLEYFAVWEPYWTPKKVLFQSKQNKKKEFLPCRHQASCLLNANRIVDITP